MKPPVNNPPHGSLFYCFDGALDPRHELCLLARSIRWERFEEAFAPLYCPNKGRPAKPIRLMTGLLILKHRCHLSDESLVAQWRENVYFQYFCGQTSFISAPPCAASELVHFRHRIGEEGMMLILSKSIRLNGEDAWDDRVSFETTVQEKNIAFSTNTTLHLKVMEPPSPCGQGLSETEPDRRYGGDHGRRGRDKRPGRQKEETAPLGRT